VIGGQKQESEYKMNCRFNKKDLIKRIKKIAEHKKHIKLYNLDALELINKIEEESNNKNTIFYFDPPYYLKGPSLYMNHYDDSDHRNVSDRIKRIKNIKWIVSYDDILEIERIYSWVKLEDKMKYSLNHAAYKSREGREIMFFSDNLINKNL
jgi:DNA adenine methylase